MSIYNIYKYTFLEKYTQSLNKSNIYKIVVLVLEYYETINRVISSLLIIAMYKNN